MNLRPKKKENIYFSFNKEIGINDITEDIKQKELNKKNEDNIFLKESINDNMNSENELKEKKDEQRYQELYPNTPRFDSINTNNKKSINLDSIKNRKIKPIVGIHKKINVSKELAPLININNIIKNIKDKKNKKVTILNTNDSVEINNNNTKIIQLPSLSMNNINNYKNNMTEVNNTLSNNNIIVLPEIKKQRYDFINNSNNKEKSKSPGNKKYILYQKNFKNTFK